MNDQQQEPKPKRASRPRKDKPPVEAGGVIRDPALYAELSQPFATKDEANAALKAFLLGVRALRIKHRIADAATVACVNVAGFGPLVTWGQNGDSAKTSLLLSFALGASEAEDRAMLDAMRKHGGEKRPTGVSGS